MKKGALIAAGVVVGAVAAGAIGFSLMQPPVPQPNVLIILWDTVRADRLTPYGYDKPTTPRLGAWAEKYGVVYEQAVSPAMWTVPSHASMFTGLMPTTHGAGYDWRWLDEHNVTFAEHFSANGYDTYAFSANPNLSTGRVNLLQGFEKVDLSWGRGFKRRVSRLTRQKLMKKDKSTEISPAYRGGAASTFLYNAAPITDDALFRYLDERPDKEKPWLAYLNYMEAHKPRVPSLDARRRVADDDTIRVGLETDLTMRSQLEYSFLKKEYSQDELDGINGVYDATLVDLDESTGDLFDELALRGLLENTIVVFTSDHGENLGEHHLFGHRHSVYQQLVHVPLIVSYPPKMSPGRVSHPVANVDIFNTLCELAGIEPPATALSRGNFAKVRDVLQAVFVESISVDRLGWDRMKSWFPDSADNNPHASKFKAVVEGEWKLILPTTEQGELIRGAAELYHLEEDPQETKNVASGHPARVADLSASIDNWRATLPAYDSSKRGDGEGPSIDSEAMRKQLEMLGYLDASDDGGEGDPSEEDTDAPPLE